MDLNWQPGASLETLQARARLTQRLRWASQKQGWLEIDPPIVIDADAFESGIDLIQTHDALSATTNSLHSSPELALKRLLATYPELPGAYSLCPVFRAGETGRIHNPQFTLFEFYQTQVNLDQIINTTVDLIQMSVTDRQSAPAAVARWDYAELFTTFCHLTPHQVYNAPATELARIGQQLGINLAHCPELDRDDWLNLLLTHIIEPTFPGEQLTIVTGFPASQAAMAQTRMETIAGQPVERACRFEIYAGNMELANGYQELICPKQQKARFEATQTPANHKTGNQSLKRFIQALEYGLPESCGVAMGIERLLLWLTGKQQIAEVMAFDHPRR